MEREKTGIKDIDSMIQGGLPQGGVYGISGPPGVGKSIFGLHYVLEGAKEGQKCLYINLEEPTSNIDRMVDQFTFKTEFKKFIKQGKIVIKCLSYQEYEKLKDEIIKKVKEDKKIKRVVIDSYNGFFSAQYGDEYSSDNKYAIRRQISNEFNDLRKIGVTSLLVLERDGQIDNGVFFNIPYLVDGVINLDFLDLGAIERRVFIPKMRWTAQYKESKEYDISNKGITVLK